MKLLTTLYLLIFILCADVVDPKLPDAKKSKKCYFSTPNPSPLENQERPISARSRSTCSEDLIDLSTLANNKDGHYFGAPDEEALVISRHEGEFPSETSDRSKWKGEKICTNHLNELSRNFYDNIYYHQRRHKNGGFHCGFPEKGHTNKARIGLELTYSQSKYLLENRHFLLLPGTRMCRRHHDELIGMAEDSAHPSSYDIGVDPSTGGDAESEEGVEDVCDQTDANDPDFKTHVSPNTAASFFYKFAKAAGVSRVRCHTPWNTISPRDRHYRANGFALIVDIIAAIMDDTADGQSELKKIMIEVMEGRSPTIDREIVAHEIMLKVAEQYKLATNTHDRIWTLAPFTMLFDYHIVARYIDHLPQRMWDESKKMSIEENFFVPEGENVKERYDIAKLVYFINFLTSPHILIGLPYGHSKVTDSHGKVYDVPYAVRQTGIYETIRMYEEYMKQNGLESMLLKRTTMYNILSYLPIKKAHSMTCVDYFQTTSPLPLPQPPLTLRATRLRVLQELQPEEDVRAARISTLLARRTTIRSSRPKMIQRRIGTEIRRNSCREPRVLSHFCTLSRLYLSCLFSHHCNIPY